MSSWIYSPAMTTQSIRKGKRQMTNVVKFGNDKQRKLSWEQQEALKSGKKVHRSRRDQKRGSRENLWEEVA